jgi:hypothetical protein
MNANTTAQIAYHFSEASRALGFNQRANAMKEVGIAMRMLTDVRGAEDGPLAVQAIALLKAAVADLMAGNVPDALKKMKAAEKVLTDA